MSLPIELLSKIFLFAGVQDIASWTRVNSTWKVGFDRVEMILCKSLLEKMRPDLVKIIDLCPDEYSWKQGLEACVASSFQPTGLHQELQKSLEIVFRPQGIVAFSNNEYCGDSGAYNMECPNFQVRDNGGICFFDFFLNGPNSFENQYDYKARAKNVIFVKCSGGEYARQNWKQELKIIDQFCAVIGLKKFVIRKSKWENYLELEYLESIQLEQFQQDYDDFDFVDDDYDYAYDDVDEDDYNLDPFLNDGFWPLYCGTHDRNSDY